MASEKDMIIDYFASKLVVDGYLDQLTKDNFRPYFDDIWEKCAPDFDDLDIKQGAEATETFCWACLAFVLKNIPYPLYLQTPYWRHRRLQVLERAGNRCQICNSPDLLNVHHRTYERRGHEHDGDLIVLCRKCHQLFHDNRQLARK